MSNIRGHEAGERLWIGTALLLILSAVPAVNAQTPSFDGRAWTIGHRQSNGRQAIVEYVLPGQSVDSWRELVTSQLFTTGEPLAAFIERLRATLSKGCPSLVWNTIRQDEKTVMYEWRDSGCGGDEPQYELGRVTMEEDRGLYRLAYAIKTKAPLAADRRSAWLEILGRVPLVETTAAAPVPALSPTEKMRVTRALAERVNFSGLPCPSGRSSEIKRQEPGPAGPLTVFVLECSNGAQYTVVVDPFGAVSAYPATR